MKRTIIKNNFFKFYLYYHRFAIFSASAILLWVYIATNFSVEIPSVAWVIDVLSSDFWEQFEGESPVNPTDFVH